VFVVSFFVGFFMCGVVGMNCFICGGNNIIPNKYLVIPSVLGFESHLVCSGCAIHLSKYIVFLKDRVVFEKKDLEVLKKRVLIKPLSSF